MTSSTSAVFTGTSTYANDFAAVITRAQGIASLPITLLNSEKVTLTAQQSAMNTLSGSFASLQASLLSLDSSVSNATSAISISDATVASASATPGAFLGSYNLQVTDPGSHASATSTASGALTVTDPTKSSISVSTTFTLTANGQTYANITPASNTLTDLAAAIQTATGNTVQTSIINLGTASSPSYQLSIQNSKYGALPITLNDDSGNLLGTPTAATSVQYLINGQATTPSDTRTLTLSPNLSVTVLAAGTTHITVGQSPSAIANQIKGFVTAYNASVKALDGQRGSNGGALAGQSIINTLSQALSSTTNYTGTGSVHSMADIGLTFDKVSYALTFDPTVLNARAAQDFTGVTAFLGGTTTGGFLKAASDTLNGLTDSTSGAISMMQTSFAQEISNNSAEISLNQDRVDKLTQSLNAQMAAADALVASMQQQATYMTNLFTAMTANQYTMR